MSRHSGSWETGFVHIDHNQMKIAKRTEFLPVRFDPPWRILYQH
ncbi:hypothetical protein [Paraburkholderia sp. J76]|nr:hypothetical protein [Paraburkholderia sp. J76]